MDSKLQATILYLLSIIGIVLNRSISLLRYPYKTVRLICEKGTYAEAITIFLLCYLYFHLANEARKNLYIPIIAFCVFSLQFMSAVGFFYLFAKIFKKDLTIKPFILSFAYSLVPTLLWFSLNSFLYVIIPPPRTFSFPGKAFSIIFITLSVALLIWKIVLFYLSLRFSTRLNLYKIMYMSLLFLIIFIPYSFIMYHLRLFRIPFI